MKNTLKLLKSLLFLSAILFFIACEKDEEDPQPPTVSFESAQISINTDDNSSYDAKIRLSAEAHKDFSVNINVTGTAVENEHFTVSSKEIAVAQGETEAVLPITILNENIWEDDLTIILSVAPGSDYVVDPQLVNSLTVRLTKDIVLPEFYFADAQGMYTNPFNAETITLVVTASEELSYDVDLLLNVDSELAIGDDFLINDEAIAEFTFPAGATSHEIEISILHKDISGFREDLVLTLAPADPQRAVVRSEQAAVTFDVYDPIVDMSPLLYTEAVLGLSGYQMRQAIKDTDGNWSGNLILNAGANADNPNYMKSFRNVYFQDHASFNCHVNGPGGDVLRLANMLVFETLDTTIADYGAARTVRYFSPSDELIRFVAEDKDETLKGTVTSSRQMFTANLVLRSVWEDGTNPDRAWQIDSRATNGVIEDSNFPTFHTINIWLEKLEGTYDFTLEEPEVIFEAWYSSDSPYFMRSYPEGLDVVKDGDYWKVTYRFYPR